MAASLCGGRQLVLAARACLDPEDLRHRREADLELLGARLLGRPVALYLTARGVEGLRQGIAVVAVAPGEHLDRDRGAAEANAGADGRVGPLHQPLEQDG